MDLLSQLTQDMKVALKSGQKQRLSVIRMLLSDVKNIDLMPNKPTAEQVVEAYAKKLRKSVEEYQKLGRQAEVEQIKSEIAVVEEYLPKKASPAETEALLDAFLAQHAYTEKQFGQTMGAFIKANSGEVEASIVSELLKKKLAGK